MIPRLSFKEKDDKQLPWFTQFQLSSSSDTLRYIAVHLHNRRLSSCPFLHCQLSTQVIFSHIFYVIIPLGYTGWYMYVFQKQESCCAFLCFSKYKIPIDFVWWEHDSIKLFPKGEVFPMLSNYLITVHWHIHSCRSQENLDVLFQGSRNENQEAFGVYYSNLLCMKRCFNFKFS